MNYHLLYLEEDSAPERYQPIEPVKINISNSGITSAYADANNTNPAPVGISKAEGTSTYTVTVYDSIYSVGIRKVNKDDMPIPGAVLELSGKNADGDPINLSKVKARDSQFFVADGSGRNNGTN